MKTKNHTKQINLNIGETKTLTNNKNKINNRRRNNNFNRITQTTPKSCNKAKKMTSLAAQKSHRKIAVTTVAASGLAAIPLQKSQGFFASAAAKKSLAASDFWGLASESQENRSDHGRKSPQPRDFAAAATTGH